MNTEKTCLSALLSIIHQSVEIALLRLKYRNSVLKNYVYKMVGFK